MRHYLREMWASKSQPSTSDESDDGVEEREALTKTVPRYTGQTIIGIYPRLDVDEPASKGYAVKPELLDNGPPISFDIHRLPGLLNLCTIVTGRKKDPTLFYVDYHRSIKHGWNLKLHQGSEKTAELVLSMFKTSLAPGVFTITMANGWATGLDLPVGKRFTQVRKFRSFDGDSVYTWTPDSHLMKCWTCVSNTGAVIATWRHTPYSRSKRGQLIINAVRHPAVGCRSAPRL
ncbi:hypothetical protein MNV49_007459 [Pseudohyphozyma bogoriensis]|nr:hypothetical protein MNV49_007459 [Pseudohyphozyma bogoriensis]